MHKMPPFGWLDFIDCEKQKEKNTAGASEALKDHLNQSLKIYI